MDNVFGKYCIAVPITGELSNTAYHARLAVGSEWDYVVKVYTYPLSSQGEEVFRLYMEELSQLKHAYILPLLDYGIENGSPFSVTRYMTKGSLRDCFERQSLAHLSLQDIFTIVEQIGQALQYAHNRYLLHGNLKPENVLFNTDGAVLLTDFSLPENLCDVGGRAFSKEPLTYYPSFEPLSEKSDQYALASLADEIFMKRLSPDQSSFSLQDQNQETSASVPSSPVTELRKQIKARLSKARARDPDQRYENIAAFVEALEEVCDPFVTALFLPTTLSLVGGGPSLRSLISRNAPSAPRLKQHLQVGGQSRRGPRFLIWTLILAGFLVAGLFWQLLLSKTQLIDSVHQSNSKSSLTASPTLGASVLSKTVPISPPLSEVGHWPFDIGQGSIAHDNSGHNRIATLRGNAGWGPPYVGYSALSLDGTFWTYVNISVPVVNTSQSFSVATWVKLNTVSGNQTFISIDGNLMSAFYLQLNADVGKFAFNRLASDSVMATSTLASAQLAPLPGVWYHVAGVYDASAQTLSLYVNSYLQQTVNYHGSWQPAIGHTAIGRGKSSGNLTDFVNGEIDDVHMYQGVLDAAAVDGLVNS